MTWWDRFLEALDQQIRLGSIRFTILDLFEFSVLVCIVFLVAAFTDEARIRPDFLEHAPTVVTTQGAVLLQNLGSELGIVLNPGSAFGFELAADQVAAILRDFRPATPEEIDGGDAGVSDEGSGE